MTVALPAGWRSVLGLQALPGARHPLDAQCHALNHAGTVILFDAGVGDVGTSAGLDRLCAGLAVWPMPAHLFLTHGHADHSGGAAAIQRAGARLLSGALTAQWLSGPDLQALSLDAAKLAQIYPAEYQLAACMPDRVLGNGERMAIGGIWITAIATPGHSADHMAYLVEYGAERVLIGGDALFAGGRVVLQDTWDCSVRQTCDTIRHLAPLSPTAILPGHGPAMIGPDAGAALAAAHARVIRLLPPELFL